MNGRKTVTRKELLREEREKILGLAHEHGVRSVKVFGSAATGRETKSSDVDFLVEVEPGCSLLDLGGLQADLEVLLGCKVDIVTQNGLRPRLRPRVLREAVSI
ncbi:nucleotidyltransferase family protein [Verrucomicrobiota bacterium]